MTVKCRLAPGLEETRAERSRRSLADFIRYGWHVLEATTPLEWNWHIEAICEHVQAAFEGWIAVQQWRQERIESLRAGLPKPTVEKPVQPFQNLLINVPPGTTKSRIVAVYAPAWMWLHWPEWKALYLSANPNVALRDSVYCREVIESDWYRRWFAPDWLLTKDQNAKSFYRNTRGGYRQARGFGAKITGDRSDALVWDDPVDADQPESSAAYDNVRNRWDTAIANRVNDARSSLRIGIAQRLSERDLSGHVLAQGGWEHVCIPQEYEAKRACECPSCQRGHTAIGWRDPRTEEGELLFPRRFPPSVLEAEKARLGSFGYAGQHQQRPSPAEGGLFKRQWWRFWIPNDGSGLYPPHRTKLSDGAWHEHPQTELPVSFDEMLQSWDMAFTDTKSSAFVVGQVWGLKGANRYLLDEWRAKADFVRTVSGVRTLSAKWPQAAARLVEHKANGAAVISSLRDELGGLIPVEPEGSKEARAQAELPAIEAGNVHLPHPLRAPWVLDWIDEHATFPNGTYADRVDAQSQALRRMRRIIAARSRNTDPRTVSFRPLR